MQDLERVRYVTTRYEQLQGLRRVPLGLMLLVVGGFGWMVRALTPAGGIEDRYGKLVVAVMVNAFLYFGILLAAVALVLYYVIGEHYERRFGRVERRPVGWRRTRVMIAALLVIWATIVSVDLWLGPPVRLDLLAMGGALLFFARRRTWRFGAHYVVMGVLIFCCGLLPLFGVLPADLGEGSYLTVSVLGTYFVVGGIFDHLLLVRMMKSLPEENDEAV